MTFLNKNSFFVIFIFYFSVALIVLGLVQSIFGTMRLYNSSEQNYEKLSPNNTYTTNINSQNALKEIPPTKESSEDIISYITKNEQTIQDAIKEMPPEKAQKVEEKIQTIETLYQKKETIPVQDGLPVQGDMSIKETVPIKIIIPSKNTAPIKISESQENIISIKTVPPTNNNPSDKVVPVKKIETTTKHTSPVEISVTPEESSAPKGYEETLWTVVTGTYFHDALWKFPIIIDTSRVEPRGQMYNESITLSSNIVSLTEVSKVLVHEIGHMIDIYTFKKKLQKADPSEEFYAISWVKPNIMKAGLSGSSFISGYGATNQYEDFAESFTMYIFHNKEFLKRAESNLLLKKKYIFLKNSVFGNVFLGSEYEKEVIPKKVWDVTKIGLKSTSLKTIFAWVRANATYTS